MQTRLINRIILAIICFSLAGCLTDQVKEDGTVADIQPGQPTPPDPNSYVCNPLDGGSGNLDAELGLHGQLFYIPPGSPTPATAAEYITNAVKVDVDLFFNQLYVPTRPFDRGFVTQGGITLAAADGTQLYEWFGIRFDSRLQLAAGQPAGDYQLAILSDDGSMLRVDRGAGPESWIENDGWHPTRMGCSTIPLNMAAGTAVPFQLDYFQGPRYHISLVMMWRPLPANPADQVDPLCGTSGNSQFFDSTQDPPAPTARYNALLSRGWQVIGPQNYALPETQEENPCNAPAPVISATAVSGITSSQATMTWATDIPATSMVIYTEVATGTVSSTTEITTFATSHSVTITGLRANTQYRAKAFSKSTSGLSSESAELTFRTSR